MKNESPLPNNMPIKWDLPKKMDWNSEMLYRHSPAPDLQEKLVKEGYPVRVYVPFGTHWYPYFMRRLAERPANIWFFITNC